MITNKLKIGLFALAALTLLIGGASVASAAVTFNNDTTTYIGPNAYTIGGGSVATSVVITKVAPYTMTVVIPASATFTLNSPNGYQLTSDSGVASVCNGSVTTLSIAAASTVVITPNAVQQCGVGGTSGGSSGGNGGGSSGGGGSSVVNTSTLPRSSTVISTPYVATTTSVVTTVSSAGMYNFGTAVLKNGSKGDAVKELQRFLNKTLNLGLMIDGKLGPKTIAVIKTWQKNHHLVADGLIGAKTKAMMNASVQ